MVQIARVPNEGIAPDVATDSRGHIHLIYFKGDASHGDIFYVRSDDGGRTYGQPLQVNSQPGSAIAIGTVRVPQLAVGKSGRVHVAWMGSDEAQPKINGKAAPMLYARMNDAGTGFERQRNLITSHTGLDGGGSVAADLNGNVYVAWHAPKTVASEADRWVWVARSADEGQTFGPEAAAGTEPTGACGCCGMKVTASLEGNVYVLYRGAADTVNRDIHLLVSSDHATTFRSLAVDPWTIGSCVMSTSAASGSGLGMVACWETKGHIRFTKIDHGKASEPSSVPELGTEPQKHPAVAVNSKGQFIIAWAEGTGWNKGGSVRWQVFDKNGTVLAGQSGRAEGLPVWSKPAAISTPGGKFTVLF